MNRTCYLVSSERRKKTKRENKKNTGIFLQNLITKNILSVLFQSHESYF